jgi:hypothetical protein
VLDTYKPIKPLGVGMGLANTVLIRLANAPNSQPCPRPQSSINKPASQPVRVHKNNICFPPGGVSSNSDLFYTH